MQLRLLFAAGLAALALPAAANAAVTPTIDGTTLTLAGDGAADTITLTDGTGAAPKLTHDLTGAGFANSADFNPVAGAETELPANGTITVVVNGGAGNDTINLAAANLLKATINGEDGDDIITGTANIDDISGGAGNDRLTGFRGGETINGDAGNDVMIWANRDGNDLNEGGDGIDETLITTGTADDNMTVTQNALRTIINRTNAPFSVDMNLVEKLTVTSFAGNDTLTTNPGVPLAMNVDAGSGDDTITTGDGADLISGNDGNDTLNGGTGGDRIIGDRGGDTFNAGDGDDTVVWNNGDNSDVMNGEGGVDRVEVNLAAAADESTLKVENGRTRYDRLNLVPFNLSIATAEVFELNTLGGDDTLITSPGLPLAVVADGGSGNDNLKGGDEADTFFGAAGNDTLEGGNGSDTLDGGEGDDRLELRDNAGDLARGGAGSDWAGIDALDTLATDVETVERPAVQPIPLKAGAGTLARTATVSRGVAALKVSCPAGTSGCTGTVTLRAGSKTVGRANYALTAGQSKTIRVKLANGTQKLAKKKKLAVKARVTSGAGATKTANLTLRF